MIKSDVHIVNLGLKTTRCIVHSSAFVLLIEALVESLTAANYIALSSPREAASMPLHYTDHISE